MMIRPVSVSDATLTSSNVAEPAVTTNPDPAAWNAATAYVVGDRVTRSTTHSIYERLVNGTTATAPESDSTNWVRVGSTNRWKMFDGANNTQTTKADSIVVEITPTTVVDAVALDNLDATNVRVQVANTDYDETLSLRSRDVRGWYDHFFEPFVNKKYAIFFGLPLVIGNKITITITKTGSTAMCGNCVLGQAKRIGNTHYGASLGIVDYSVKDTDSFGNTAIVERAYSKRMNVQVQIEASRMDEIHDLLAQYRATPIMYVGAGDLYGSMLMFGYYKSFDIVVAYRNHSECNLEIEGLT